MNLTTLPPRKAGKIDDHNRTSAAMATMNSLLLSGYLTTDQNQLPQRREPLNPPTNRMNLDLIPMNTGAATVAAVNRPKDAVPT